MRTVLCTLAVLALSACTAERDAWAPVDQPFGFDVDVEWEWAPPGTAVVDSSTLVGGDKAVFTVTGAEAGATMHFFLSVVGTGTGPCALGVCLDVLAPFYLGSSVADDGGLASRSVTVPVTAPVGSSVYVQVAEIGSTETTSGVYTTAPARADDVVSHSDVIQPLWDDRCAGCHDTAGSPSGGLFLKGDSWDDLVGQPSVDVEGMFEVRPGFPDDSYLWHKLNDTHRDVGGSGSRMPKGDPELPSAELDLIEAWILGGAAY